MNLSAKIRRTIICSQIIAVLMSFTPNLNAHGLSFSRYPSKKAIFKALKKTLPAVVHLEAGPKKDLPNLLSPFPYYAFLSPTNRINSDFKEFLNTHLGTGIIIDPYGHILTNAFLVNGAYKIRVCIFNGKWFDAKLIENDLKTDLSILKITRKNPFPHIVSGNSDEISTGEWVIALGHRVAFKPTITEGIICAKHRKAIFEPVAYSDFLQTDARISLSNSGGPLIDLRGKAIGVNDALLTRIGKLQGIGFAIPWNIAIHIAHQLISNGKVAHGWLGLRIEDVILRSDQATNGYIKGVMVVDVIKDSPAQKAGIKPGDIIISYQKSPVYSSSCLKRLVSVTPVGKTSRLGILRRGSKKEVLAKIGLEYEKEYTPSVNLKDRLGISVMPLKANRNASWGKKGVVICWVDPNGPMGKAGFEINDIILEANGHPILTQNDLKRTLETIKPGHYVMFLAIDHRTHRTGYVQIRIR